ncbi:MAG: SDR family oxidoreductase [Clostridia bacterium]|nr:SDR family oxidoreductase [Clostridia bacterium]
MFNLKGKKALVTGSTQGIGFAIAETLAKQGATVYVHGATSIEKCRKASEKIAGSIPICVDLSTAEGADKLYEAVGDVDVLVLNASIQYRKAWEEITSEEFDKQIQTNLKSSLRLIQLCAPKMKENKWGRILTIGSVQQYKPHKDMLVYATSKAAQMNMVQNLAKQLAPFGITVNNLAPGVIATPRNDAALADPDYAPKVLAGIPCGYAGESQDLAGAALLLCSDEGRYITGIDLVVDGGMRL